MKETKTPLEKAVLYVVLTVIAFIAIFPLLYIILASFRTNKEIFEYALKSLNHDDKSSVLMVGDSLSSDIKGGLNASIDTCWCNLANKINNTDIVPKYEINNLLDLKNIL